MDAPETTFKIEINGKDATNDLTPYLLSITYSDNLTGKADELCIEVDNSDNRFLNDWFFTPGSIVKAWIGQMFCGQFMIDEPTESGPPHVAEFKAQSAEFNGPLRTKKSFNHHKKSLKDIVQKYANDHNLKVVGSIPDLNFTTKIQMRESDIDFLHNLAVDYGCICSVKGGNLVFDALENVWKTATAKTIYFKDVMSYHFITSLPEAVDASISASDDAFDETTHGAIVEDGAFEGVNDISNYTYLNRYRYTDPVTGKDFADLDKEQYNIATHTISITHKKAESTEEGKRLCYGELLQKKNKKHKCSLLLPGNELLVAGNSVNVLEFGKRSGYWLIEKSVHKLNKSNSYTTSIEIIHGAATTGATEPAEEFVSREFNSAGGDGSGGSPLFFEKNL